ncbi:hypothetical protein [Metabacillus sp. Hm71]|uniref:hypothetical protein n=1 Tax=Metabacillus sp. Hm71 TaxID=3450743 RepID=UPI003F4427F9
MSENQTVLREAENKVIIEGTLLEKRLEEKEFNGQNGKRNAITGELDIETAENEVHTVRVFSFEKKADGSDNGIFKGLKTVDNEYKSVADNGREEADKVRITQGQIGLNEYYGQDGMLRSFPQISANFINRVQAGEEFEPKAEFEVEAFIKSVSPEVKNEEETGRVKVEAIIPAYGGKVLPFSLMAPVEAAEYIEDNYEPGSTAKIYGDIINFKEKKIVLEDVAFGKPKEKVTYNTVREYLITGGSEPYEEENNKAYDVELIKKALTEREIYLAELKAKKDQPKQEEKKGGFNTKSNKTTEKKEKKKIDLPF